MSNKFVIEQTIQNTGVLNHCQKLGGKDLRFLQPAVRNCTCRWQCMMPNLHFDPDAEDLLSMLLCCSHVLCICAVEVQDYGPEFNQTLEE